MKRKIGTLLGEVIYRRLRVHAARHGRSVSSVIEESLSAYLALHEGSADERIAAFERFTSHPYRLSPAQLATILEEDALDQ